MPEILSAPNIISVVFISIIVVVGLSNLSKPATSFKAANIPNYLISLGILGTFSGIFWGLINFDANNPTESVPDLLDGIRLAFATSVSGMVFALLIKRKYIKENERQETNEKGAGKDALDIENVLNAVLEIRSCLAGGQDSLLSQFKDMRSESRDGLNQLNNTVGKFHKDTGKSSVLLLRALKTMIADFNRNLNEQFGENFKQLNQAVGRMLEWQNQYRSQLDTMIEAQKQTSCDMEAAANAFNGLLRNAESLARAGNEFREIMGGLASLLQALEEQRNDIAKHVKLFADISEKAQTGLPKVEEKLNELSVMLIQTIEEHSSAVNKHIKSTVSQSGDLSRRMMDAISRNNEEFNQNINEQIQKLDHVMEHKLTEALEAFGKNLAAISEKFAEDYTPLTERLQKVVEIAKRLR